MRAKGYTLRQIWVHPTIRVASDDLLERDRMWCRAITATQKIDRKTGRLVLDVANFLHQFNEVERCRSNAVLSGWPGKDETEVKK